MDMKDELTPAQGRVMFHMERLFRSAGGRGVIAHQTFLRLAKREGLPERVDTYTKAECVRALILIEKAARQEKLHLFRDIRTNWEDLLCTLP